MPPAAGFRAVGRIWRGRVTPAICLMIAVIDMLLAAPPTVVHQPAVLSS
jgi:hypothetical protein